MRVRPRKLRVPDIREIFKGASRWGIAGRLTPMTISRDPRLLKKLGIEEGSRILVVAGYAGKWARALAEKSHVHYSDVSLEAVKYVRENPGKIKAFLTRDALFTHETPLKYDWSFSFEPFPLQRRALPLALVRSLLNKKGAKVVYSTPPGMPLGDVIIGGGRVIDETKPIARIYGAKTSIRASLVDVTFREKPVKYYVLTLETNGKARRKAYIDLKVLRELRDAPEISLSELMRRRAIQELKITPKQLNESLQRIEEVASLVEHTKDVTLKK